MAARVLAVCGVILALVAVWNASEHDLHRLLFHGLLALALLVSAWFLKRRVR